MNKCLSSMAFNLLIVLLYSLPQAGIAAVQNGSQNGTYQSKSTQSPQAGTSTQPAGAHSNQSNSPSTNVPGGATDASGGGAAGAAGSAVEKSQIPESPETPSVPTALSESDLRVQLQNALSKEPTLSGDSVNVAVSADSIDVNGNVATAREKQTAIRIVQSYAGNKKVVSHLTVTGRNRNAAPSAMTPKTTREEKGTGAGDVSARPGSDKDERSAGSRRPPG